MAGEQRVGRLLEVGRGGLDELNGSVYGELCVFVVVEEDWDECVDLAVFLVLLIGDEIARA